MNSKGQWNSAAKEENRAKLKVTVQLLIFPSKANNKILTWARRAINLMTISMVKTTVKIMLRMSMMDVKSLDCS